MTNFKNILKAFYALAMYSSFALADGSCRTIASEATIRIPDMTIPNDTPIGSEIGKLAINSNISAFDCPMWLVSQEFYVASFGPYVREINGLSIYSLGGIDSGIGYAIYGSSLDPSCSSSFEPVVSSTTVGGIHSRLLCKSGGYPRQPIAGAIQLRFFKIGQIKPGLINSQNIGGFKLYINFGELVWPNREVKTSPFRVNTFGCQIDNPQIAVNLGEVSVKDLATIGSAIAEKEFTIPVHCDTAAKIKLTISAGSSGIYDSANGLLNLAQTNPTQTAQGIKIQMLSNGIPINFNKEFNVGMQQASGIFSIPLTARYFRVAEPLASGNANGSAIYTISYE